MKPQKLREQHIQAFRAVMLLGSMTEAARKLHTSQPQISRLIGQLEDITGFALFDRSVGRLVPTADGSRYIAEVERLFVSLAELESAARDIRTFASGRLRIAAMPRIGATTLTNATVAFKADYPEVMVTLHTGPASIVHSWVRSGYCDMGLVMLYRPLSDVTVRTLESASCVAIIPQGHPLSRHDVLRPEDFAGEPFISFPNGNPFRDRLDEIFRGRGIERKIVAEVDLGASVSALVSAGLGVSITNSLAANQDMANMKIKALPFLPQITYSTCLITPPFSPENRIASVFTTYLLQVMGSASV